MKRLLFILAAMLIAGYASAQWDIEGYTVYKDDGHKDDRYNRIIIKKDSIKFKQARAVRFRGTKEIDFYKMVNRLAHEVFTDDDLIHLSKGTNYSDASCSAFVQPDGTITIYALGFPYEDAKIFTQAKIEKWMKLWENENLQGYVEFFRKPDIPSDKVVGQFLFSVFYFGDD